jgi:hypothetical protein
MYSYDANLATEPLNQSANPQITIPQASLRTVDVATPKNRRHGWIAVVSVLIMAGLGLAAYLYLTKNHVTVADLVNVDVQNTSYLHPKQWKSASIGVSGYGDFQGVNGKSSQLVGITVSPSSVGNVTSKQVDSIRPMLLDRLNESTLGSAMQNGDHPCTSAINLQKEADTSSSETTIGLYNLTATCQRSDGTFLLKMHGVVGMDGYVRTIGVAAPQELWKTNQQAYQKMLDSLQQKNPGV